MCLTQSTPIIFLSTPSARRATIYGHQSGRDCHISIHALREEGDHRYCCYHDGEPISIHALREEGDWHEGFLIRSPGVFLSTPSARRATRASISG